MVIQAVFWDWDNTLLPTEELHWKKHQQVLASQGILLEERFRSRVYENNGSQNWLWMTEEMGLKMPEKDYLKAVDAFFQAHSEKLALRPGVLEVLRDVKEKGILQAIVTNARRDSALPCIAKKQIETYFQFVLCKEDYEGRKPEPTPYLTAVAKMESILNHKLWPSHCLAIEDDPKGVESASRAGLIAIHRKIHREQQESAFAHYSCFEEEPFKRLIQRLTAS